MARENKILVNIEQGSVCLNDRFWFVGTKNEYTQVQGGYVPVFMNSHPKRLCVKQARLDHIIIRKGIRSVNGKAVQTDVVLGAVEIFDENGEATYGWTLVSSDNAFVDKKDADALCEELLAQGAKLMNNADLGSLILPGSPLYGSD